MRLHPWQPWLPRSFLLLLRSLDLLVWLLRLFLEVVHLLGRLPSWCRDHRKQSVRASLQFLRLQGLKGKSRTWNRSLKKKN